MRKNCLSICSFIFVIVMNLRWAPQVCVLFLLDPHGYCGYASRIMMIFLTGTEHPHDCWVSLRVLKIVYTVLFLGLFFVLFYILDDNCYLYHTIYTRRTGKHIKVHPHLLRIYLGKSFYIKTDQDKNFSW